MLTKDEASALKWRESLYFICAFNMFVQPFFMIWRYRKMKIDQRKAMLPAIVLVPLFNFGIT